MAEENKEVRAKKPARKYRDDVNKLENVTRGRGKGRVPVTSGFYDVQVSEDDVGTYMQSTLDILNLPKIDFNDPSQVLGRINEYYQICGKYGLKPTVSGYALAFGWDRKQLLAVRKGDVKNPSYVKLTAEAIDLVKKGFGLMENMWENYMQNGKINPASGIFLGKNNFDYVDVVQQVVTPTLPEETFDVDKIQARYNDSQPDEE